MKKRKPVFGIFLAILAVGAVAAICLLTGLQKKVSPEPDFPSEQEAPSASGNPIPTQDSSASDKASETDSIPDPEDLETYWYEKRDYPLQPGTLAWDHYLYTDLFYKIQTPPEDLLQEMSSDELAALLLRYPYLMWEISGFDRIQLGLNAFEGKSGIFRQLLSRQDGIHSILKAFEENELDIDLINEKHPDARIQSSDGDRFVRAFVTCYQDSFTEEDVTYYQEIYAKKQEAYYSRLRKDYQHYYDEVIFSIGDVDRSEKNYVYTREDLLKLRELWYQTREYPDPVRYAPSGYLGVVYQYFDGKYDEEPYLEILNPPADLIGDFTTQELATLTLDYPLLFLKFESDDDIFAFLEDNCAVFQELQKREDGISCLLKAYEALDLSDFDLKTIRPDELLRTDPVVTAEVFSCRFVDHYANQFSKEDIRLYQEIYTKKKMLYDKIENSTLRATFETVLSPLS